MTTDYGRTRKRHIGGTQGRNKNQKTKRSNENRRKTRPGARREEDAAGRDKAPEVHDGRPHKETEPRRRNGQIAFICQTKKDPARKRRASIHDVDPRTQRATEATQRVTGYNPPKGRDGRSPDKPGYRQTKRRWGEGGGRDVQPGRRDGPLTENAGHLVGVKVN